eukprot:TRINITY_DN8529_c0_g1_i1.p2 TRINITY_DN8529_c0_g1~~TRINITY_DN8529_c0_g1_i1.p2  ORF type:complete len:117 (+),score=21.70 TRINITY_DN8529_c0_g1_i1:42-392(+)
MGKGTTSFGLKNSKTHCLCKRCGLRTYHIQKKRCASCGYPSARLRSYNWAEKSFRRRGIGCGRMRYMKKVIKANTRRQVEALANGPHKKVKTRWNRKKLENARKQRDGAKKTSEKK